MMSDLCRNASPESRKVVKWNAEDTMSWLRRDHSASKEDYMVTYCHCRHEGYSEHAGFDWVLSAGGPNTIEPRWQRVSFIVVTIPMM